MEAGELAHMVDTYGAVRKERLVADKAASELKKQENSLYAEICAHCKAENTHVVGGRHYSVKHVTDLKPVGKDWIAIYDWIVRNANPNILHKRLSEQLLKDMAGNAEEVPGVDWFEVDKLSVSEVRLTK
jgi:hypothetical protein